MRVFVTTSDWYNPILPCFAYLFNRFWSPQQQVTVLCYTLPDCELPSNFSLESLGQPSDFGNDITEWSPGRRGGDYGESFPTPKWSDSMQRWAGRLSDPHFVLMQIDYFIHQAVNVRQIQILEKYVGVDDVVKIDLSADRFYQPHTLYATEDGMKIIESDQQARYRSSLQAAIWTRDYFVSVLKPNRSPWEFEYVGMHEQMNNGKRILGVARADFGPVPYLNVYDRGEVCWSQLRLLDQSIRAEMFAKDWIGPRWNGWVEP
jgi:hypothetical protein